MPRRDNAHSWVRLRFAVAIDADLKAIAQALDDLVRLRNQASYDLRPARQFASPAEAQNAIQEAKDALALLDRIESGPARRAAAVATIPP